jgi:hypothetical protein
MQKHTNAQKIDDGAENSKTDVIKYPRITPWMKGFLITFFFKFMHAPMTTIQLYAM